MVSSVAFGFGEEGESSALPPSLFYSRGTGVCLLSFNRFLWDLVVSKRRLFLKEQALQEFLDLFQDGSSSRSVVRL